MYYLTYDKEQYAKKSKHNKCPLLICTTQELKDYAIQTAADNGQNIKFGKADTVLNYLAENCKYLAVIPLKNIPADKKSKERKLVRKAFKQTMEECATVNILFAKTAQKYGIDYQKYGTQISKA